jgi:hypothetical protein
VSPFKQDYFDDNNHFQYGYGTNLENRITTNIESRKKPKLVKNIHNMDENESSTSLPITFRILPSKVKNKESDVG